MNENKTKALEIAMAQIEKAHGKGAIMKMGDTAVEDIAVIPTGALSLDLALGVGGYPKGRIVEIFGPESAGKSTLSLHAVAEAQKLGGVCAYIDTEHALNAGYAQKLGVNLDSLLLSQPDYGEQALEIAETLVRSGAIDMIIIDSVAALVPKAEIEGDMGDPQMGGQARLMSQALRKLAGIVNKSNTIVIFVNQIRDKIGVMFGSPETTPGGRALKFYASIRLDIRRIDSVKSGVDIVGNKVKIKVVKNKVAPPFKFTEVEILFGTGISSEGDLLDLATNFGFVEKSGTWFSVGADRMGQGRESAKTYLKEHPEIIIDLQKKIKEKLGIGQGKNTQKQAVKEEA